MSNTHQITISEKENNEMYQGKERVNIRLSEKDAEKGIKPKDTVKMSAPNDNEPWTGKVILSEGNMINVMIYNNLQNQYLE